MPLGKNKNIFHITTIAGFRYRVTLEQVLAWFLSRKFLFFSLLSVGVLIALAPQNISYDLDILERLVYWPIMTFVFILVYIAMIYVGSKYARSKEGRFYYSPFGLFVATAISTYGGAFLIAYLTGNPADLSVYKTMEILFNMLLACLFEGAFFILSFKNHSADVEHHPWEDI